MCDNYQDSFFEFLQSLRMTKMSIEVWADTDAKKEQTAGKLGTLNSAIELGTLLYDSVPQKEKQSV